MVDFITKLPLVVEKDAVLVMYDRLSKMVHFVATTKQTLVEGLVRDNVWKLHRLPESIIVDRGSQSAVELTKELNKILGAETKLLMAFHLQTDKQTE